MWFPVMGGYFYINLRKIKNEIILVNFEGDFIEV